MRFPATVRADGSLLIFSEEAWKKALAKRAGQRVEVELRSEAQIRSARQNRFFHGPVLDFVASLWWKDGVRYRTPDGADLPLPKEAVKDALVTAFGGGLIQTPLGKARRRSTADMTVAEFSEMLERIGDYCLHKVGARGVLPSPEEWSGDD